jgi:hypothetical protein
MHHSEIMVQKQSGCPIGESIPQTSAVCSKLPRYDYSRAAVLPFLVPYCFLGSGVLLGDGSQVLEGYPTW